ncbi:MAG: exodeoxyribonuclease V subunit beta [Chlamydia suis]|nr:exodeoxyribonuclease V subunit beta [Chlamydia suis]
MSSFDIFLPTTSVSGKFFLEASAGTGKTFTIEQVILRSLLEESVEQTKNILVVTFTNAATNELKLRIQACLKQALALFSQALAHPGTPLPPYIPSSDAKVKQLYIKIRNSLATLDEMNIFTIHGFCRFALEHHFPWIQPIPHSSLFSEPQTIQQHILDYLRDNLWEAVLSPKQFAFLSYHHRATTQQTRHLSERLLQDYASTPHLALPSLSTFLQKLDYWVAQYKHLAPLSLEELQTYALRFKQSDLPIDQELPAFVQQFETAPNSLDILFFPAMVQKFQENNRNKKKTGAPFSPLEPFLKDWLLLAHPFCQKESIFHTLLKNVQEYLKTHCAQSYSHDESIATLESLLTQNNHVVSLLRKQFQLVLIDEFQDTDKCQWQIFSKLFASPDYSGSLFLIGDPKQSIYEWRNADLPTYLQSKSSFPTEAQLLLDTNYRSTPQLMQALNHLFSQPSPFLKSPQTILYHPLHSKGNETVSYAEFSPVHFFSVQDVQEEALWITQTASYLRSTFAIPFGNMAVLVQDYPQALKLITHSMIPMAYCKEKRIFDRTESPYLLILLLEALLYPDNQQKMQAVLLSRLFSLSANDIRLQLKTFSSLFFTLNRYLHRYSLLATFYKLVEEEIGSQTIGETLLQTPLGDIIFQEIEELCLYLDKITENPYHKLFHLIKILDTGKYDEELSFSSQSNDENMIKITTVHSSKGLEYDVVFCSSLNKVKEKSSSVHMREMYVACTRAKKFLFVPYSHVEKRLPSTKKLSALANYAHSTQHNSIPHLVETLTSSHPELFSSSTQPPESASEPVSSIPLPKQNFFSLPILPSQTIYSFSSTIEPPLFPGLFHENSSSLLFPGGSLTGTLIHKVLESLAGSFQASFEEIFNKTQALLKNSPLEEYTPTIAEKIYNAFSTPLPFASGAFSLQDVHPHNIRVEETFLLEEKGALWQGIVDLFFEHKGKFFIVDWKTSFLGDHTSQYSPDRLLLYVQQQGLDKQEALYKKAANRFLQQFHSSLQVEMAFVFIRGIDTQGNGFLQIF